MFKYSGCADAVLSHLSNRLPFLDVRSWGCAKAFSAWQAGTSAANSSVVSFLQDTEEDKAAKEKLHQIKAEDGTIVKLKVDKLLGRRKLKKDYEYEVRVVTAFCVCF